VDFRQENEIQNRSSDMTVLDDEATITHWSCNYAIKRHPDRNN